MASSFTKCGIYGGASAFFTHLVPIILHGNSDGWQKGSATTAPDAPRLLLLSLLGVWEFGRHAVLPVSEAPRLQSAKASMRNRNVGFLGGICDAEEMA